MDTTPYPTQYGQISNQELLSLFGTSSWDKLSFESKMDACQEVENRYAAANQVPPCKVTAEPMLGGSYGYQGAGVVTLNEHLVRDGQFVTKDLDDRGNVVLVNVDAPASNWNVLDTVFHEGTHGIQESQERMAETYISPSQDYDIYRIQQDEKEAFAAGQNNTLQAISIVQQATGQMDPQASAYYDTVRNESFQAALQNAAAHYNDPNIEATLSQVIYDRDHGITRENPSPSYAALNALCEQSGIQNSQQPQDAGQAIPAQSQNNDLSGPAPPGQDSDPAAGQGTVASLADGGSIGLDSSSGNGIAAALDGGLDDGGTGLGGLDGGFSDSSGMEDGGAMDSEPDSGGGQNNGGGSNDYGNDGGGQDLD